MKLTRDNIIQAVCRHYDLPKAAMFSQQRFRSIARPRQLAMYLIRERIKCECHHGLTSLPKIAAHFGGRDHTTVLHALRKIEELLQTDSGVALDYYVISRKLDRWERMKDRQPAPSLYGHEDFWRTVKVRVDRRKTATDVNKAIEDAANRPKPARRSHSGLIAYSGYDPTDRFHNRQGTCRPEGWA